MDESNRRPPAPGVGGEAPPQTSDWKKKYSSESRQQIVNKILEELKKQPPVSGPVDLPELKKIANRFEQRIFRASASQQDYMRKIDVKLALIELKSKNPGTNSAANSSKPPDEGMQPQLQNQGSSIKRTVVGNQQHQNNMAPSGVQGSAALTSTMPSASGINQTSLPSVVNQNSTMQDLANAAQNSPGNPTGQGLGPNVFVKKRQRQRQRQSSQSQNQQQPNRRMIKQNLQQVDLSHTMRPSHMQPQPQQQSMIKQNLQQVDMLHTMTPSHMQQRPHQQSMVQSNHIQSAGMQPAGMQATALPSFQQNIQPMQQTTQPMLQQHQQPMMMRHIQPQHAVQQKSPLPQQQMMAPQQQPCNSSIQVGQRSAHMLQQPKLSVWRQLQGFPSNMLPGQQSQLIPVRHLMSQMQSQSAQLPQQMGLQQPQASLQRDMQQRLQVSGLVEASSMLLDSTVQAGQAKSDGGLETFLKLKSMEEMYFLDLDEMYQRAITNLHQVQLNENQMNPRLQSIYLQGSVAPVQQNNLTSMQHGSMNSFPGVAIGLQNMMNTLQSNSSTESWQGGTMNSLQQVAAGSMQQNPASAQQQINARAMSSQSGLTILQPNANKNLHANSDLPQNLKQRQEQQMQEQFKQQYQQNLMQLMQKQHLLQQQNSQLNQQAKQQLQQFPDQMQAHQMLQLHQIFQHSSPQIDQQCLLTTITNTGTPLQTTSSTFMAPSPSTPLALSPRPVDSENQKPASDMSSLPDAGNLSHQHTTTAPAGAHYLAIGTAGTSASLLLPEFSGPDGSHGVASTAVSEKSTVIEQPIERLIRAVKAASPQSLSDAVHGINSVLQIVDRIAGSAPGNGSRAAIGEDLVDMTRSLHHLRDCNMQDGWSSSGKMKRSTVAITPSGASSAGSLNERVKRFMDAEPSDLEATATSSIKRLRTKLNHTLIKEIMDVNNHLIDTVLDIIDGDTVPSIAAEGSEGIIVKCSFIAVSLSPSLKSQYGSEQLPRIEPFWMRIPFTYPSCSPVLLDGFPVERSKELEDVNSKVNSRFVAALRSLPQPMAIKDIARTWDACSRSVILEYAEQNGGGSFISKYGTWERC
ncbi:hypothetical protein SAY87_025992 [Trapa incisa]|uniref:Mediator complex subunit 15 KIX domain-containing protein n=1 Tax=Trapa incisa TaxID=236973 RepID=A0AAN7GSZ2_9MYRT|nr:hypothetical protein SAY87_025992 [Trapa incisa]